MNIREFFAERLKREIPGFVKVIRALPEDRLDYKPHEKNTPAGVLAAQIAMEMGSLPELLETGQIDYRSKSETPSLDEIATSIERSATRTIEMIATTTDERWHGPGKFLYNGQAVWEATVEELAWGFLLDLIHHRGQLTAYIRPMGGKVPAVYGPSADER